MEALGKGWCVVTSEPEKQWGEMDNFNLKAFVDVVNEYMRCDETERALWVLNNMPGYYRENTPKEIYDLKTEILSRIQTPTRYAQDLENPIAKDNPGIFKETLRGDIILSEVKLFNKLGMKPHVVDLGPGDYGVLLLLDFAHCDFTYESIHLHPGYASQAKEFLEKYKLNEGLDRTVRPTVFIACEIIEHLPNPLDIKTDMLSRIGLADTVHISTPLYTFDQVVKDWREKRSIEHLRTYTEREFHNFCVTNFPEYHQSYFRHGIQHVRLSLRSSKFQLNHGKDIRELAREQF